MSSTDTAKDEIEIARLPVNAEEFSYNEWTMKYTKSHILHSICTTAEKCKTHCKDQCLLCL